MNILITGTNGQLGNRMRRVADIHRFTGVAELDITNVDSIRTMVNNTSM